MDERGDEILVNVSGLSKKFSTSLRKSLAYGLKDATKAIFGIKRNGSVLRKSEFWALRDINFKLRRGECLGLIGRNGAGKSTLLKMLNGLIPPDEGEIVMKGRVGALIELGAGFNPLLTGRENIYINGQLLGFSKSEIDEKMNTIVEFSELGKFIDSPVQNYSSGMKVRLGFAIAAQMEPDILIIDEVLAVGDLGFVLKCFNTIDTFTTRMAVIFVSHNMPQVSRICTSVLMLENGQAVFHSSDVAKGIETYYSKFKSRNGNVVYDRNADARFVSLHIGSPDRPEDEKVVIRHLDNLDLFLRIDVRKEFRSPFITITIADKEQRAVGVCMNNSPLSDAQLIAEDEEYLHYRVHVAVPRINLSGGIYSIALMVHETFRQKPLIRLQSLKSFQVISENEVWPSIEFESTWS